ncbi:acyl-CoA N-acyltransferase [Aulographum hederae CBS 113979]|uniref:Acyl-CoA N-acyltransferase n=1 Tax=Aulographum hederae CBS 113979 TaxID=1176131 RepID=A0A6G1H0N2_9PEZI|nr:acyl-CoA N-acyltransferase [Aulographum hederae CBS 113979]
MDTVNSSVISPSPDLKISIRPATLDDIPQLARIAASTFAKDELFTWMYPRMDQYPDDMYHWFLIKTKIRFNGLGSHVFVAEVEDAGGKRTIAGQAVWERGGKDEEAKKWKSDTFGRKLERRLLQAEMWYYTHCLERASDPVRISHFEEVANYEFYSTLPGHWHLAHLVILPQYQRKGIAKRLIAWGVETARQEHLPVTLEASRVGRKVYEKIGFRVFGTCVVSEGLDSVAMLWEPEELKGRWLKEDQEVKMESNKV